MGQLIRVLQAYFWIHFKRNAKKNKNSNDKDTKERVRIDKKSAVNLWHPKNMMKFYQLDWTSWLHRFLTLSHNQLFLQQ